jgi:hypothetical protein
MTINCLCGEELELYDPFATECPNCKREYNGAGQLLAPREQWEDDTGEKFT